MWQLLDTGHQRSAACLIISTATYTSVPMPSALLLPGVTFDNTFWSTHTFHSHAGSCAIAILHHTYVKLGSLASLHNQAHYDQPVVSDVHGKSKGPSAPASHLSVHRADLMLL